VLVENIVHANVSHSWPLKVEFVALARTFNFETRSVGSLEDRAHLSLGERHGVGTVVVSPLDIAPGFASPLSALTTARRVNKTVTLAIARFQCAGNSSRV